MSPAPYENENEPNIVRLDCKHHVWQWTWRRFDRQSHSDHGELHLRTHRRVVCGYRRSKFRKCRFLSASVRAHPLKCKRSAMTAGFVKGLYFRQWPPCPEDNAVMARCFRRGEANNRRRLVAVLVAPGVGPRPATITVKQARSFHTAIRVVRFSIGHQRSHSTSYGNPAHSQRDALEATSFFELSASRRWIIGLQPQQPSDQ